MPQTPRENSKQASFLKCQFHIHVKGDPCEKIPYDYKQLIKRAKQLNYDVLAITSHRKVIFNKKIKSYAKKNDIILFPGIELEINNKHILVINADKNTEKIQTFEKLKNYKKLNPDCLIIAPHPFFPGKNCLKKDLIENIQLFDAIEYSYCYTTTKNYNKEAIKLAKRWKKPLVATSDCHILKYLDLGYTFVNAKKNPLSIIKAVKKNKVRLQHSPIGYFTIFQILLISIFQRIFKIIQK